MENEKRLIDANDFLVELKERHENIMQDPEVSKRMKWCEAVHYGATTAIIEKMPTIEAAPVVHGRWIGPTRVDANNNKYECSECGFWGVPGWAACPKCTAKMDGGVSDG